MCQIFSQDRSMQRADRLNVQSCSCFEKFLHLCTVFTNNTDIITTGFAIPVFLYIKSTKFTKSVCGKQNFVRAVICNHNFRPVNHRCKYKCQDMFAQCQTLSVSNNQFFAFQLHTSEEIFHHGKSLCICNNSRIRICFHEVFNVCRMIRLHMLYNQIIRLCSIQDFGNISKPFFCEVCIYRIHNCDLFIFDHI